MYNEHSRPSYRGSTPFQGSGSQTRPSPFNLNAQSSLQEPAPSNNQALIIQKIEALFPILE